VPGPDGAADSAADEPARRDSLAGCAKGPAGPFAQPGNS
jgi:hypothetical protein